MCVKIFSMRKKELDMCRYVLFPVTTYECRYQICAIICTVSLPTEDNDKV